MANSQEISCENFTRRPFASRQRLSLAFVLVVLLPSPSQASSPVPVQLADVQDRFTSIDQAGLCVLLDRVATAVDVGQSALSVEPLVVYSDPNQFRGKLLRYKVIVNPHPKPVTLARATQFHQVYYVTAKIPFDNNQQMPAIIVFLDRPNVLPVDQAVVTGYFYMVLRQETQESSLANGPTKLYFSGAGGDRFDCVRVGAGRH